MTIEPIGHFESPLTEKFGLPRQAGLASSLRGSVVLHAPYNTPDAVRGLEAFDYLWIIWGFSLNGPSGTFQATVRPPRLGGNTRIGVFASRSPFRPNGLGLSSVRIVEVLPSEGRVIVAGADLADGTPVYDIKPYVAYADAHPDARSGFVDDNGWTALEVIFPEGWNALPPFSPAELEALRELLAQDPRPQFQHDPSRIYHLKFAGREVRFRVNGGQLEVIS